MTEPSGTTDQQRLRISQEQLKHNVEDQTDETDEPDQQQ